MTQRVLGSRRSARRRWIGAATALFATSLVLVFFAVSASARQGSSAISLACPPAGVSLLTGSNLEIDANANLKIDGTSPCTDWNAVINPPGAGTGPAVVKNDKDSGSGDDSFTNGSAINDIPKIDSGSIPPSKSDLKSFGVWQEGTGGTSVLNLFWSRVQDPNGTTDMDFEFNQNFCDSVPPIDAGSTCDDNTPNGGKTTINVTPVRLAGDILITYLLSSGGTNPSIKYRTWTCNGGACAWSAATDLSSSVAIGSINTSAIPGAESDIGAQSAFTFGEASVNVAAILGTASCRTLGSAYLKSRASDTDSTAGKDFIAPERVSVTNCGSVLVKKVSTASSTTLVTGATFKITKGKLVNGSENANDTFTDGTKAGYYCIDNIKLDSGGSTHSVEETVAAPGYDLPTSNNPQTVSVTKTASCATRLAQTGTTLDNDVDLTFADPPSLSAIQITKNGKDKSCVAPLPASCSAVGTRLLSGAVFEIKDSNGAVVATSSATNASGVTCVGDLPLATYTVSEKTAPTGYAKAADQTGVALTASSTCAGTPQQSLTFVDQPKTNITVSVSPQVAGTTASKISCTDLTPDPADSTPNDFDDVSETYKDNVPGTYTCTVVIDP
jgi:Prealbumin-like fold domain